MLGDRVFEALAPELRLETREGGGGQDPLHRRDRAEYRGICGPGRRFSHDVALT
jgi:hypothetical protein